MTLIYIAAAVGGSCALILWSIKRFQDLPVNLDVEVNVELTVDVDVDIEPLRRFHPRALWRYLSIWLFLAAVGWTGLISRLLIGWGVVTSLVLALVSGVMAVAAGASGRESRDNLDVEVLLR